MKVKVKNADTMLTVNNLLVILKPWDIGSEGRQTRRKSRQGKNEEVLL